MNTDTITYVYLGKQYNRAELEAVVTAEAATLDPEQWLNGTFEFNEWLSDSIVTGTVTRLAEDL